MSEEARERRGGGVRARVGDENVDRARRRILVSEKSSKGFFCSRIEVYAWDKRCIHGPDHTTA